ncbi:MAG: hypothetical protein R2839_12455 [Thermomicrobiales bacterium]
MLDKIRYRLRSWEGLLLAFLVVVLAYNISSVSNFLTMKNQVNLFQLSIEKSIVALVMAFVIINGEIDLSVASMMGMSAAIVAYSFERGLAMPICILLALAARASFGFLNGYLVAVTGISSLAVTLAGYIGYRGLAQLMVEDASIGGSPPGSPNWDKRVCSGRLRCRSSSFSVLPR